MLLEDVLEQQELHRVLQPELVLDHANSFIEHSKRRVHNFEQQPLEVMPLRCWKRWIQAIFKGVDRITWSSFGFGICSSRCLFSMPALFGNHGVRDVFRTGFSKLAPDTFPVALRRVVDHVLGPRWNLHEVPLVQEVDDVLTHSLAHCSWIHSCCSSPVHSTSSSLKMAVKFSSMTTAS